MSKKRGGPLIQVQDRYCHCGRLTMYASADYDLRSEWWLLSDGGRDMYWLTVPREFCEPCHDVCYDIGGERCPLMPKQLDPRQFTAYDLGRLVWVTDLNVSGTVESVTHNPERTEIGLNTRPDITKPYNYDHHRYVDNALEYGWWDGKPL